MTAIPSPRVRIGDPLVAAHAHQGLEEVLAGDTQPVQRRRDLEGGICQHGQEEVLLADVFVLHAGRGFEGLFQKRLEFLRNIGLHRAGAAHLGQLGNAGIDFGQHHAGRETHLL